MSENGMVFGFFVVAVCWLLLCSGDPDIIDAIVYWIMTADECPVLGA